MNKPTIKFKVNQQSAEVGGKLYGIVQDNAITPENSILQICEFKKITAFAPEQVLRLVEDVCDGAAQLVARDGQSRQLSTLLKFSPRVRGTFDAVDSRWTDQKLIVGARLLKDIKLDMDPSKFVMSNVADVGTLTSAAWISHTWNTDTITVDQALLESTLGSIRINGAKLDSWSAADTLVDIGVVIGNETFLSDPLYQYKGNVPASDFAGNGFSKTFASASEPPDSFRSAFKIPARITNGTSIDAFVVVVYHPDGDTEFKRLSLSVA